MRFGENVLCQKYIEIYEFQGVWERLKKTEKVQEHDLY